MSNDNVASSLRRSANGANLTFDTNARRACNKQRNVVANSIVGSLTRLEKSFAQSPGQKRDFAGAAGCGRIAFADLSRLRHRAVAPFPPMRRLHIERLTRACGDPSFQHAAAGKRDGVDAGGANHRQFEVSVKRCNGRALPIGPLIDLAAAYQERALESFGELIALRQAFPILLHEKQIGLAFGVARGVRQSARIGGAHVTIADVIT